MILQRFIHFYLNCIKTNLSKYSDLTQTHTRENIHENIRIDP